jgi:hypothetical protein
VPDYSVEIAACNPAILLHEHFSYFDVGYLTRLIESVSMHAIVMKSGFGRCRYVLASLEARPVMQKERSVDRKIVASYPERCSRFVKCDRDKISNMATHGTVGVYCAARGHALLDRKWPIDSSMMTPHCRINFCYHF